MDDILIGHVVIKDGVTMLETETDVWIRQPKIDKVSDNKDTDMNDHESEPFPKYKSRVCNDCDYVTFIHSECDWFCNITNGFTKGYCEVAD